MDIVKKSVDSAEATRLREALELHTAGVAMMEQNLRRRYPDADEETIRRLLREWLHDRPGAEHGDGVGRPRPNWPDRSS